MKKSDIVKELEEGRGVLAKHGTWGLYLLRPDGTVGHCYAGRVNPKTAEELVAKNPSWGARK